MKKLLTLSLATGAALTTLVAHSEPSATISGAIEVEASFGDNFANQDQSDITLATVELGIESQINERVAAGILILHEDDDTEPAEIDEAIISYAFSDTFYLEAGRMYPFGNYDTNLVSDPLTLEIGETRAAAVKLGFGADTGPYGSFYMFNGDTIEASTAANGDDTIEHFGAQFGYVMASGDNNLKLGFDYISSIGESFNVAGALTDANGDGKPDPLSSYVSAFALHATYTGGPFTGIFEYLVADQFQAAEMAFKGNGAEISAMNLEGGYNLDISGTPSTLAVAYQTTDEALALGLAESKLIFGLSMEIESNTQLSFEYSMADDYSTTDGGTGGDSNTITAQLAVSF